MAPIKKNHSMLVYMEPETNSLLGPIKPQNTALAAYPLARGQKNCFWSQSRDNI